MLRVAPTTRYFVWDEVDDVDGLCEIEATTPEAAAERFCHGQPDKTYPRNVVVESPGWVRKVFEVTAQQETTYHAKERT